MMVGFGYLKQKLFAAVNTGAVIFVLLCAVPGFAAQKDAPSDGSVPVNATGEKPEWMKIPSYRYDSANKPDPFIPFISKEEVQTLRPLETKPDRPLSPLEKIDATQLKAIGILWYAADENKESLAMVQLPDGKGFVLKKGMRVGRKNGVVDIITPEAIVVKERGLDMLGKEQTRDVLIKLHSKKRAQND